VATISAPTVIVVRWIARLVELDRLLSSLGHLQELGIVPYASYVEQLRVVAQEGGQDTVPVVDHDLVGQHAIAGLAVAVAVAAADTARDEGNYKTEV
jgi:hypothetical protein